MNIGPVMGVFDRWYNQVTDTTDTVQQQAKKLPYGAILDMILQSLF